MKLVFADAAWEDYLHWQAHDAALFTRINHLLREIQPGDLMQRHLLPLEQRLKTILVEFRAIMFPVAAGRCLRRELF